MSTWRSTLVSLLALACATGCFSTTVRSGAAPGKTPVGYDYSWHSGFFWGLVEVDGPYDANAICPGGWSEISTEVDFWSGLVGALTGGIYYPQRFTLVCAAGGAAPMPAQPAMGPVSPPPPPPAHGAPPQGAPPQGAPPPPPGGPPPGTPPPGGPPPEAPPPPPGSGVPPSGSY